LSNQLFSVVIQKAVFPKMVSLKLTSFGDSRAAQIVVGAAREFEFSWPFTDEFLWTLWLHCVAYCQSKRGL